MKYLSIISAFCSILFASLTGQGASAGGFAILFPPDRSFVQSELINVVTRGWPTDVDEIQLSVNGTKQSIAAKQSTRLVSCYDGIHLSYGMNKIKITTLKRGKKTEELTTQVFFRTDLSPDSSSAPAGFKEYLFHTDTNEQECISCHPLDFRNTGDKQGPDQSPCHQCHKKILSDYKFVHGPSAVWSCLMCHDGTSRRPKLAVAKPDDKICLNCHENMMEKKKYMHGPSAAGACTTCHNPHAADEPYFLRKSVMDLCGSCHEEIFFRPHVIVSFSGQGGHPLYRSPDPLNPGRDLTCVSCHSPHAGNSAAFLNGYDESRPLQAFCTSCHRK